MVKKKMFLAKCIILSLVSSHGSKRHHFIKKLTHTVLSVFEKKSKYELQEINQVRISVNLSEAKGLSVRPAWALTRE